MNKTVRKRLYDLIKDKLYMFCRSDHDRTYKVIEYFLLNSIIYDEQLRYFLKNVGMKHVILEEIRFLSLKNGLI